jgi:hypothetical protein
MALTPQQQKFKEAYLDPGSPTYNNAKASAIAVGYDEDYADQITARGNKWMLGLVRDQETVEEAEKRLREILKLDISDTQNLRGVLDAIKIVLKGLAKEKYSERYEHSGPDGKELPTPILQIIDKYEDKN